MMSILGMLPYGSVYSTQNPDKIKKSAEKREVPITVSKEKESPTEITKNETVYVITDADGQVKKIIVSDFIQNGKAQDEIQDRSRLSQIETVRGEASFQPKGEKTLWASKGEDIYYKGVSDQTLPVSVKLSYTLDGNEITPEALLHQSGRVVIRFDYENHEKKEVSVKDKKETLYVPFVMMSALSLDNDHFKNIEVENGKILNDGDRSMVVGLAFPKMNENLKLKDALLNLPDYLEISADVTDFTLEGALTVAGDDFFSLVQTDKELDTDQVDKAMKDLKEASRQLTDGSEKLKEGTALFYEKTQELKKGTQKLHQGADALNEGMLQLQTGAKGLDEGMVSLENGLSQLCQNEKALIEGSEKVFASLLKTAETELLKAGVNLPALTPENYRQVLSQIRFSASKEGIEKRVTEEITKGVEAQKEAISAKVTLAVEAQVLTQILEKAGLSMSPSQYKEALSKGQIPPAQKEAIEGLLKAQMAEPKVQEKIQAETQKQMAQIIEEKRNDPQIKAKVDAALAQNQSAGEGINSLLEKLGEYEKFHQGLLAYTQGVAKAHDGSLRLKEGSQSLVTGNSQLSEGAQALAQGLSQLDESADAFSKGAKELSEGASKLSSGMKEFEEKGISKILDFFGENMDQVFARMKALSTLAKEYHNFSGIEEGMKGSVKFIYRTEAIE